MSGKCAVEDCTRDKFKVSWCNKHYKRWYRNGDPTVTRRAPNTLGVTREYKRQWIIDYKLEQGCADCGYRGHHAALDFDHRPGTEKVRDIRSGSSFGWESLLAEISKCDVVCANCHRVRTYDRYREGGVIDGDI